MTPTFNCVHRHIHAKDCHQGAPDRHRGAQGHQRCIGSWVRVWRRHYERTVSLRGAHKGATIPRSRRAGHRVKCTEVTHGVQAPHIHIHTHKWWSMSPYVGPTHKINMQLVALWAPLQLLPSPQPPPPSAHAPARRHRVVARKHSEHVLCSARKHPHHGRVGCAVQMTHCDVLPVRLQCIRAHDTIQDGRSVQQRQGRVRHQSLRWARTQTHKRTQTLTCTCSV